MAGANGTTNSINVGGGAAGGTLPAFSAREVRFRKAPDANVLLFAVPTRSSLLLPLLRPASHAYEQRDWRWLHLLQAAALVPSRKVDKLRDTAQQALKLLSSPALRLRLEAALRPLLDALGAFKADNGDVSPERLVIGLQLKDRVTAFLREWIADPVEGLVLRKEHVVGAFPLSLLLSQYISHSASNDLLTMPAGLRLDDVVATPVGAGYLRAFRREDGFCTVVYPWGHGFIHLSHVEKAELALRHQLRKRKANEFVPLEHQHLFEQVESLAENLPPERADGDRSGAVEATGIDVEEYKKLLESLEEEVRSRSLTYSTRLFVANSLVDG